MNQRHPLVASLAVVLAFTGLWVTYPAAAVDLGVQGTTYPIKEPSFMLTIAKRLEGVDWEALEKKKADAIKDKMHHLDDAGLSGATETKTRYIDISVVLDRDVQVPEKQPNGTVKWRVMGRKGQRVNPLDKVQPLTRMLVFNPDNKAEHDFAVAAKKAWPTLVELLVSRGDPDRVAKEVGAAVFYANQKTVKRFQLLHTPCLIGPGQGAYMKTIAVTEFGPGDLRQDSAGILVKRAWYGLKP